MIIPVKTPKIIYTLISGKQRLNEYIRYKKPIKINAKTSEITPIALSLKTYFIADEIDKIMPAIPPKNTHAIKT